MTDTGRRLGEKRKQRGARLLWDWQGQGHAAHSRSPRDSWFVVSLEEEEEKERGWFQAAGAGEGEGRDNRNIHIHKKQLR